MLQVSRAQKMLGDEFGTASNIKNRVNRQSVLGAITSAQQRLKLHNKVSGSRINTGQLVSLELAFMLLLNTTYCLLPGHTGCAAAVGLRVKVFRA